MKVTQPILEPSRTEVSAKVPPSDTFHDEASYPYRYGVLAMQARLFLMGHMDRAEFVRLVNAINSELPPIQEEPRQ